MSGAAVKAARRHAQQLRAEEEQQRRRRARRAQAVAVVAGLVLLALVAVVVQSSRTAAEEASPTPAGLVDGGVAVGRADAPVVVTAYEDPACPACAAWSHEADPVLEELVDEGVVRLDLRPVAILDGVSPDQYSTRAVAAAGAVADAAPDALPAFFHAAYAEQPREGSPGLTTERLAELAVDAVRGAAPGVADAAVEEVRDAVLDQRFAGWAARTTDQASRDGLRGTPTVLVDGQPLAARSAAGLRAAVEAAAGADG